MDPRAGRHRRAGSRKFFAEVGRGLIAYARHEFTLDRPGDKGGPSLRKTYRAAAAQGSVNAQIELAGLPLPGQCVHVWQWFGELHMARGSSGFGPLPIGHAGILAWMQVTGRRPTRQELEWLQMLDATWLMVQAGTSDPEAAE